MHDLIVVGIPVLAIIIGIFYNQHGLSALEGRLEPRFASIDARFNGIDAGFDAIEARFNAVDARFNAINARFDSIEERLDGMQHDRHGSIAFSGTMARGASGKGIFELPQGSASPRLYAV